MARSAIYSVLDHNNAVIDEIVADCNGDLRGAVKALLLVNEQLETELNHFRTAAACGWANERPAKSSLH
jgi:hypothetical protein